MFFSVWLSLVFGIGHELRVVGNFLIGVPLIATAVERLKPWSRVLVYLRMLLYGIGNTFFDMPLGASPLGLLTLTLALASTGLGMLLGSVARTRTQAGNTGMVLGFVLFFASGLPPSSVSRTGYESGLEGLRLVLSQLTPHAHLLYGYLGLMPKGAGVADTLPKIILLLGFAAVFLLLGLWRFRYE